MGRAVGEPVGEGRVRGEVGPALVRAGVPRRAGLLVAAQRLVRPRHRDRRADGPIERANDALELVRVQQGVAPRRHGGHAGVRDRLDGARPCHDQRVGHDQAAEVERVAEMPEDHGREARGPPGGVPIRIGDERAHDARHGGADRRLERRKIHSLELRRGCGHARQRLVGVLRGAPVPRIVLRAGERSVFLAASNPDRRLLPHSRRVGAEGARLHDRVLRFDVEVAHRREHPVDPRRPRLGRGDDPAGVRGLEVAQVPERRGRGQLGQAHHLLGGAAFQIGPDEERPPRLASQLARERRDGLERSAEDDEPAYPGRERGVDLPALMVEPAGAWPPAKRRKDEPGERAGHAGVMWPRMRGPRAPVAAGRLPALPVIVRNPKKAKASASFASPSKNSRSKGRTGRGRTRAPSCSTRTGFFAPPPETTSSASGSAGIQPSTPRAIVSTVSAVAVATASLSDPPASRTRSSSRSANPMPKRSRPVLFGGRSAKYGSARSLASTCFAGFPRRACSPSRSKGAPASMRRVTASITPTPGPVSNASAPSITPRRGTQVTFAMPPMLRSSRPRCGWPNNITSASGTSGAPCPPAATSRDRKSLTTRAPTRSAITAGSPSWSVARPGSCQIVCPCEATNVMSRGEVLTCARSWSTAPAKRSPSATWSSARSLAPPRAIASMRASRSAAAYGSWRNATSWAARGSSLSRTSAVETPSSDVPDINPTARAVVTTARPAAGRPPPCGRTRRPPPGGAPPPPSAPRDAPSRSPASHSRRPLRSHRAPPRGPRCSIPSRSAPRGPAACRRAPSGPP